MGTRGIICIKYRSKYYKMYNHYDSYGSELGLKIMEEINTAIEDGSYDSWKELIERCKIVYESNITESQSIVLENCKSSIIKPLNAKLICLFDQNISTPPKLCIMIQYVYILDLDNNTFFAFSNDESIECKISKLTLLRDFMTKF